MNFNDPFISCFDYKYIQIDYYKSNNNYYFFFSKWLGYILRLYMITTKIEVNSWEPLAPGRRIDFGRSGFGSKMGKR